MEKRTNAEVANKMVNNCFNGVNGVNNNKAIIPPTIKDKVKKVKELEEKLEVCNYNITSYIDDIDCMLGKVYNSGDSNLIEDYESNNPNNRYVQSHQELKEWISQSEQEKHLIKMELYAVTGKMY